MNHSQARAGTLMSIVIVLTLSGPARGDGQQLSKPALEAFERGRAAFKVEDWNLAVRHFSDAQRAAPYHANVLFNLGLAHARAGHDLAGAAWLSAYLAAVPPAEDAGADPGAVRKCPTCGGRLASDGGCPGCVKAEILRLEVVTESQIGKIFRQAIDLAKKLEDPAQKQRAVLDIISAQGDSGDLEGALETVRLLDPKAEDYAYWRDSVGERRAVQLMGTGDRDGADAVLRDLGSGPRGSAGAALVAGLLERGAVDDALGTDVFRYCDRQRRDTQIGYFLQYRIRDGNFKLVDRLLPHLAGEEQIAVLAAVAEKKIELGDAVAAREAALRGTRLAEKLPSVGTRTGAWARFASLALRAGDEATAREAAEKVLAAGAPTETDELARASVNGPDGSPRPPPERGISCRSSAVAAAIVGRHDDARAYHWRFEGGGESWGPYTPLALITLIECLTGNAAEARKTAKANGGRERGSSTLQGATPAVAMARYHLSRSETTEALAVLNDSDAWFGSSTSGYWQELHVSAALALARAGDLGAAMKAYSTAERSTLSKGDPSFVSEGLLALAQILIRQKSPTEVPRILQFASKVASVEPLCDTLSKIADLQISLGDLEAGARTKAFIVPPILKKWVSRAIRLSASEVVVDLGTALSQAPKRPRDGTTEACRAVDMPGQIARVASSLRSELEQSRWLGK